MAKKEGGDRGTTRDSEARAASPLVGIVLLFALVMMGAMLVFVAGSAMFDAIQSEADREQAQQFMLETDHRLSTVAETKTEQVLPDGVGPADVTGDGRIEVAWYANGSSSDPWNDASCSVEDSLGTLEYEQAGGTIAHQGGGVWETTNGGTSIVSEPDIGYDNDTLQLQILQLDNGDFGGSEAVARADHSNATDLTRRINNASTRCNDRPNVAIRIESEYHDGWHRFLEDSLGEDEYKGVNVTQTGGTVEARIEEVREPVDRPTFVVAEDRGLSGPGKTDLKYDQRVEYMDLFTIEAMIENTESTAHTENVTVSIWDENFNTKLLSSPKYELTIAGNDTETIDKNDIAFSPGNYKSELEPGESYRYVIETESGDRTDDPPGSFYVGRSGSFFNVTNANATVTGDTATITTDLQNTGIESESQNVTLELDYQGDLPDDISDPYGMIGGKEVPRSFGESNPVEFTLNASKLIDGEYVATIRPENGHEEKVPFNITAGIDPGRVGLGGIEDAKVTVEIMGSQVSGRQTDDGRHQLYPLTLDIVANGETEYSFTNPNDGDNINTGPTWQNKNDDSFRYEFAVDEETDLTLRNTRYADLIATDYFEIGDHRIPIEWDETCVSGDTNPSNLGSYYSGPNSPNLAWCNDVPAETEFGPIDASQGQNLQNVRVRSSENNTIPALPAGADQQMSATEVLQERGLIKTSGDELDLDPGEFVFLFDNTVESNEDDIDALWDDAVEAYEDNPNRTNDPDFNDLIVYVEVERAGVNPGKPGITIQPGGGDSTDVGTGNSDSNETGTKTNNTGISVDTDSIVVG